MLYSTGVEDTEGFEFWGDVDGSYFGHSAIHRDGPSNDDVHLLTGWNGSSPTMGCLPEAPPPMCLDDRSRTTRRQRVMLDWPAYLATARLRCETHPGRSSSAQHDNTRSFNRSSTIRVVFASFGDPTGTCADGWRRSPACNRGAGDSEVLKTVAAACDGKVACTVPVRPSVLWGGSRGDDNRPLCRGTPMALAVTYACDGGM